MFSIDSKFDECFKCFVVEFEFLGSPGSMTDFICTESADKPVFFLKFNLSHKLQLLNVQHNFYRDACNADAVL